MKKWIGIAAVLIVLLGTGLFFMQGEPEKTASSNSDSETAAPEKPDYVRELAENMTLEEKVGQMFLACVSNSTISREDIASYGLGGYLFFSDFFEIRTPESVTSDLASYQKAASVPMLMAVDEEGGSVVRISKYSAYRPQPFASPQGVYAQSGFEGLRRDAEEKSEFLLSMGINVNLAPVCDLTSDQNAFIYPRTLGENVKRTSRYIREVVSTMNRKKIGSALKHFPGYGGNADTHTGIATDTRSYQDFVSRDFLPFEAGIEAGAPCVLVSHNIVTAMDESKPASLSENVHQILREELGFDGVILTDDLAMEGVQGYSGEENIAVSAIQAGNDLLCTSRYTEQIPAVVQAVRDGKISEKQITDSALRVLRWKEKLGLFEEKE